MNRRIQPYDRKRWFQIHCCRSTVNPNPLPFPDVGMALGLVMTGLLAVLAVGAMVHFMGVSVSGAVLATAAPVGLNELQGKLDHVLAQYKEVKEQGEALEKKYGALPSNIAETLVEIRKQVDAIDIKIADKLTSAPEGKSLMDTLKEDESVQRIMRDRKGSHSFVVKGHHVSEILERKTTIDANTVGFQATGVMPIDRTPGIVSKARQQLRVRDLLSSRPTSMALIDFVKVNADVAVASMQTESADKVENAQTFTAASQKVETLATIIPASRQILDDWSELLGFLKTSLAYAVNQLEDRQLLHGNGTSPDLNGLATQATAFNTALLSSIGAAGSYKKFDYVGRAVQQLEIANEISPSFILLHPTDYWDIRMTKDSTGQYIFPPGQPIDLFDLTPVRSTNLASGEFLVGNGDPAAAEVRPRMEMEIMISTEHSDYFKKNLVAVRAEKREALIVYRPASFIKGTFTVSP